MYIKVEKERRGGREREGGRESEKGRRERGREKAKLNFVKI